MQSRPVCLALPADVLDALDKQRKRDARSRSNLASLLLRRALEADGLLPVIVAGPEASRGR